MSSELARAVRERGERARASGALEPLATRCVVVTEDDVPFQVRVLERAPRKPAAPVPSAGGFDRDAEARRSPFLRPDPELAVAAFSSPTHRCLLNKYPVVEGHVLLVTRELELQDDPLTRADFAALAAALGELEGWLGFYNAGPVAGGSQPHKHLQLVPPLVPPPGGGGGGARACPLEARIRARALPFPHAVAALSPEEAADPDALHAAWRDLRGRARGPYNLLATRAWMLHVPRVRPEWEGVAVNALGFAGAFLVRDAEALERLRRTGPWSVLRAVSTGAPDRGR